MLDSYARRLAESSVRQAKAMEDLVKVMEKMNSNFVEAQRKFQEWCDYVEPDENQVETPVSDADQIHKLVEDINVDQAISGKETTITNPREEED
jgi:hypothetical protein